MNFIFIGLHNWIYFSREELANRVNYLGYLKYELLNDVSINKSIYRHYK